MRSPASVFLCGNPFINEGDVVVIKNPNDPYFGYFAAVMKVTRKRVFILLPYGITVRKRKNLRKAADASCLENLNINEF